MRKGFIPAGVDGASEKEKESFGSVSGDSCQSWCNTAICCRCVSATSSSSTALHIARSQTAEHLSSFASLSRDYPPDFNELWLKLGHSHTMTLIQKDLQRTPRAQISQSKRILNSLLVLMMQEPLKFWEPVYALGSEHQVSFTGRAKYSEEGGQSWLVEVPAKADR